MKLAVIKLDNYKFAHRHGTQSMNGWGIQNEAGEFLTFDTSEYPYPYNPSGKKATAQIVADTIIIDNNARWIKPIE